MLIAAIVCGLVTAYYFGLQAGMYAAAAGAGLSLVAVVIPPWAMWSYAIIAIGLIGVCLLGPRFGKPLGQRKAILAVRMTLKKIRNPFK